MTDELEILDPSFRIELPTFEGPLDLLLHLIQTHELNILDLPIAFVTKKYVEYVSVMQDLNLDVAAEYLVMAATLAHIKSKLLLPELPHDGDAEQEEDALDPRAELIRRLLEYQKYKTAALALGQYPVVGRDVFGRGSTADVVHEEAPLAGVSLFALLDAFGAVLKRTKAQLSFAITSESISITDRISQITDTLRFKPQLSFEELFENVRSTSDVVVTFLAVLEMAKMRLLQIYQNEMGATIHLRLILTQPEITLDAASEPPEPIIYS